jgi:hypothetical protein
MMRGVLLLVLAALLLVPTHAARDLTSEVSRWCDRWMLPDRKCNASKLMCSCTVDTNFEKQGSVCIGSPLQHYHSTTVVLSVLAVTCRCACMSYFCRVLDVMLHLLCCCCCNRTMTRLRRAKHASLGLCVMGCAG